MVPPELPYFDRLHATRLVLAQLLVDSHGSLGPVVGHRVRAHLTTAWQEVGAAEKRLKPAPEAVARRSRQSEDR